MAAVRRVRVTVAFFAHRRKRPQDCFTLVFTLCGEFFTVLVECTEEIRLHTFERSGDASAEATTESTHSHVAVGAGFFDLSWSHAERYGVLGVRLNLSPSSQVLRASPRP